jgi:cyclase
MPYMRQPLVRAGLPAAIAVAGITLLATAVPAALQAPSGGAAQPAAAATGEIEILPVQGNVYMIVGAGANITASVGDNGVLLVDTGSAAASQKVLAAVRTLSTKPIQFIVNTNFEAAFTGGNEILAKAGRRVMDNQSNQAVVLGHENVLNRMSAPTGEVSPRPVTAWPTDTFFSRTKEVFFNGEGVQIIHRPARSDSDSFVFFRKSDVISAGPLYSNELYPMIDVKAGGHINGVIDGLNDILELTIPMNNAEDGTLVIPGSGRLSDELDVAVYRDMVTIIRDRVQDAIKRGQTLAQVQADKRLTLEYEERFGAKTGPWTTAMFLEAVFSSLKTKGN